MNRMKQLQRQNVATSLIYCLEVLIHLALDTARLLLHLAEKVICQISEHSADLRIRSTPWHLANIPLLAGCALNCNSSNLL